MARPSRFQQLVHTVTGDVIAHPRDLTRHYATGLNISRVAANKYIQRLESEGWIARSGPATRPVFSPGYKRRIARTYNLAGLEEDIAWERDFRPYFNLSANVLGIAGHGFTEMVNNAIDHSAGTSVHVRVVQDEKLLWLFVADDGVGVFEKITAQFGLPDIRQALFELAKGKLTTDPSRHTGEGIFFTSRMFDSFQIIANELRFRHDDRQSHDSLQDAPAVFAGGTVVSMDISLDSAKTPADVYARFTGAPEDFDFSKTVVPMKLARYGDEQLVSRSQAKRLIARFDRFKTVELDFSEVHDIGQAFADELFRVYASNHPGVELVPRNMTKDVERMYLRAVAPRLR